MMNYENRQVVEKKPERIAGQRYTEAVRVVDVGGHGLEALALHLVFILGKNEWKRPIWKKRELKDGKEIELEKFEDYLLLPPREGLKLPSLRNIDANLRTLPEGKGMEALKMLRDAIPDWKDKVTQDRVKQTGKESPELAEHRRPTKYERDKVDNINFRQQGGTSAEYLASRIKRDAPAIAKRLENGEFKSVRAAAKAAGIVKTKSPLEIALSAFGKLSESEKLEFLSLTNSS